MTTYPAPLDRRFTEMLATLQRRVTLLEARTAVFDSSSLGSNGWTTYTPTWTASTTNPTVGNGTLTGQYVLIGKTCFVSIILVFGSTTGVGAGTYLFGVPFPSSASSTVSYLGAARFTAASVWIGQVTLAAGNAAANVTFPSNSTTTTAVNMSATSPVAPASGNQLTLSVAYQTA